MSRWVARPTSTVVDGWPTWRNGPESGRPARVREASGSRPGLAASPESAARQKRTLRPGSCFVMLGAVVSAQDEFRGFLRDLVSPAMRSAGLSGSAGRYYLPSPSCFALVGFQKSEWSTGSAVTFTVNLKVVSREVWNSPGKIGA